jgi:hypothetical protein
MASTHRVILVALVVMCVPLSHATGEAAPAKLTADEIVAKNVAARGGVQAWHAVQTLSWAGKIDAGVGNSVTRSQMFVREQRELRTKGPKALIASHTGADARPAQVELPFALEMKRPSKQRFEVEFAGKTAVQVYDGHTGWLKRPYLNRDDWEPFSPEQTKTQAAVSALDGPLVDYAAKGTKLELAGTEPVEGHDAYKLKLTMSDGSVRHVWIDARSFLDVKIDGAPRRMDGKMRSVAVFQRDFRRVQGITVPYVLETAVDGYPDTHKIMIEKVTVNPPLDDARFVRPNA